MSSHPTFPETFVVQRDEDVSGISGEGIVAEGARFSDGWVVTHWLDQPPMHEPKTDVWHNKGTAPFDRVHGHGGRTRILWAHDIAAARRKALATVVDAFDVPPAILGTDTELTYWRAQIERILLESWTERKDVVDHPESHCARFAEALTPLLARLVRQREHTARGRDRAERAAGRAYVLADRWSAAHGSAMFLVRTAGAELRDELDDSEAAAGGVVHLQPTAQASEPAGVDEVGPAAECSAQYHGHDTGPRRCIRAAQHRGDHVDENGFHWSDTVAVYPVITQQETTSRPAMDPVHILGVDAPTTVITRSGRDTLTQALREAIAAFRRVYDETTRTTVGYISNPVHPSDFDRWGAALDGTDQFGANDSQACPYCTGGPQIIRSELGVHVKQKHARVLAVLANGGSLDAWLADPEARCTLPHEMEA
ncbi:hypothetical protein [Streptomyces sp. NPDC002328]|uniref:hypothetical protein n=1 Tax=Streptomyces sp. NPDC002328 TaxID=3364642 RepID=UPI00367BDF06